MVLYQTQINYNTDLLLGIGNLTLIDLKGFARRDFSSGGVREMYIDAIMGENIH
jgi:hypothetical protein